jgi:hypothetical protein
LKTWFEKNHESETEPCSAIPCFLQSMRLQSKKRRGKGGS